VPEFNGLENNFTAGQLTPLLGRRSDFERYKNAVKTMQNMTIMPQGGVTSRPGSIYVAEVKDSSKATVLIPFEFSTTQAYILEFGDLYMRVYKDSGLVLEPDITITGITQANPGVITATAHGLSNGDQVYLTEIGGMTELNSNTLYYTVANKTANTFEIQDRDGTNVDTTSYTAYTSGGVVNRIYTLTTTYAEADLANLRWTQSADVLSIVHNDYVPRDVTRTSDTSWSITDTSFVDGPFLEINDGDTTITPSATSGSITWTASSTTGINDDTGFQTTDVGRIFRWFDRGPARGITGITQANPGVVTSASHGYANGDRVYITDVNGMTEINDRDVAYTVANVTANTFEIQDKDGENVDTSGYTAYTSGGNMQKAGLGTQHTILITGRSSTTVVTGSIVSEDTSPLSSTVPQRTWRLGAWSDTTGYPGTVTYHQLRRVYANTTSKPDTIWGSAVDDFTNFEPGTDDSNAYTYTLANEKVNAIYWLASSSRLRVGTEGGIWSLWGGSDVVSITPTNVEADSENLIRCKDIAAASLGNITLYAQRSGKALRELVYSFEADGLVSPDVSVLAEDILGDPGDTTDAGVVRMAWQTEPVPTLWCVKDNGEMAAMTYLRDQNVIGWHNHVFGGTSVAVESVAVVPITGQDRVWVIVKRTINGVTRRSVEQLDTYYRGRDVRNAIFMDSTVSDNGETFSTTLTPAATTGDSIAFTASGSTFVSGDVGRIIEGNGGKAEIVTYNSATSVDADILTDFTDTSAIAAGSWTLSQSTIDGLDHLEGETVTVLADGGSHPDRTVSGGSITLDAQYTKVKVGLGYTRILETLDIDLSAGVGTVLSSRSKVNEVILEFFETVGGFIGFDANSLTEILFREGDDLMNTAVPIYTGFKSMRPKSGWRNSNKTYIKQTDPLPMTILGLVMRIQASDRTG